MLLRNGMILGKGTRTLLTVNKSMEVLDFGFQVSVFEIGLHGIQSVKLYRQCNLLRIEHSLKFVEFERMR